MPDSTCDLFRRIPETLFRPLAGRNRGLYWGVLCTLFTDFFSGDVCSFGLGVSRREVIDAIERHLSTRPEVVLETEDDEDPEDASKSSLSLANKVYRNLIETGWLSIENENFNEYVLLDPFVSQLLGGLMEIASGTPAYFGGRVQTIYNTVKNTVDAPYDQALAFHEVCKDAQQFARSLHAIVVRIRDVHSHISGMTDAKDAIRAFFEDFVSQILIADYKELKTTNHPFRYRFDILALVERVQVETLLRNRLINAYTDKMKVSMDEATVRLEKDLNTLHSVFSMVDRQLERIDDTKYRLESRVYNIARYNSRAPITISRHITATLNRLKALDGEECVYAPLLPEEGASEDRLYQRPHHRAPPPPRVVKRRKSDPRAKAMISLEREARLRRYVTEDDLSRYVERHLHNRLAISSDALSIITIKDYCAFLELSRLPINSKGRGQKWRAFRKRFDVTPAPGEVTENDYITSSKFIITRRSAATLEGGNSAP